ncbi:MULTISPECIES: hypothetical protein [Micromonospora]|uniref:Uncharacterized protein n=1 Tax=Micromonospora sicca TaxID=2202420 RepID=A0A317D342_9ACTN|nr:MULTISPECIES: hypothetical protein [unclassified Micromonospora]MBM0225713.1 hypothetical protein [Micromonospora sp. ATA51]PWR09129.1 hypothetical protein DKT69_31545 [Micromonospora sp. 4G51]
MSEQVAVAPAPPARESEQQPVAPSTPAAGRSRIGTVLGVVVLILGVLVALAVGAVLKLGPGPLGGLLGRDGTADAKAGDCVAELPRVAGTGATSVDDATIVPCTGARAAYAVVGRVDDPAAARSRSAVACEPHFRPGDDGYVLYRVGGDGDGYLLCLVRKANGR